MEEQMTMEFQQPAMTAGIGIGVIIAWLVFYVFFAFCLANLAKRLGVPFGKAFVWAIIPIANLFLIIKLAEKPMWWFILFFVPIANLVVIILMWMAIAERRGKPGWWGVLIALVPIVNIILFLILCFGKEGTATATATV